MKIFVAVSGASGAIYAKRLLEALGEAKQSGSSLDVTVCFSTNGRLVWQHEIGGEPQHGFRTASNDDFACLPRDRPCGTRWSRCLARSAAWDASPAAWQTT